MPVRPDASVPLAAPFAGARSRRDFLRLALLGGAAALLPFAAACNDDPFDPAARATIDLRTDDGLLNGLYVLLQLKGELFHRVYTTPFVGMTRAERDVFLDVRDHAASEIRYLTDRLGTRRVYDLLLFDFSAVELATRAAALGRARDLCDGVSAAHHWTLSALRDAEARRIVAKTASAHARHAAVVRTLANGPAAFADEAVVDPATGLARVRPLGEVIETVRPYFLATLDVRG